MLLGSLIIIPIVGIILVSNTDESFLNEEVMENYAKQIALIIAIINLIISLFIFIWFNESTNQYQFILTEYDLGFYNLYLGVDGQSIYFVLLTTFIIPIALISNWNSIVVNVRSFLILILLLEALLIATFLVLDILLFYIFFESTLIPLFLLIGMWGSTNKVRASYYLFLYTLFGSLFMLLAILVLNSIGGTTDIVSLSKINIDFLTQKWLFGGFMLAIAIKTPFYGLHTWLLKAHVEAPLSVSILLAAVVLKLGLYAIMRIVLPILPEASLYFSPLVYTVCVISIVYGSLSTLRCVDIKEIVAYSSVCHASVYILGVFSNSVTGIEGAILLGLAHGFASSGLFISVGGVLYDRTGTRNIFFFRGMAQYMPLFSLLFFILALANCGTPLTFNFVGELFCIYGALERLPLAGIMAASSIVFSAAYSIYLFNRICFGGSFSPFIRKNALDLTKREFFMLFVLVFFTVALGLYPSLILDGLHCASSSLIYGINESLC